MDVVTIEELELQYIERLLGHRPTPADASLLPGIDISDRAQPDTRSGSAATSRDGPGEKISIRCRTLRSSWTFPGQE